MEHVSVFNLVDNDKDVEGIIPVKPPKVESFKLVETVKDLEELAAKLHSVDEFAVKNNHFFHLIFEHCTSFVGHLQFSFLSAFF
ncbi:hypothetical protein RJT34_14671 [Clitoria ternatea]|uniref:Uncharacterized protein n=1 Tax=Clitoria ternatea TaxID=43366 RepID=A0AAN9JTP9_CLITE